MKKIASLFLAIFLISEVCAQNLLINFAGTGASTTVDSVKVVNLIQSISLTLSGNDTLHLIGTAGINQKQIEKASVHVSPNPMFGKCECTFYAQKSGEVTFTIYSITGLEVFRETKTISQGRHTLLLNNLTGGVYLLNIQGDSYICSAKIISVAGSKSKPELTLIQDDVNGGLLKTYGLKLLVNMPFTAGDSLGFTAYSGTYTAYSGIVPVNSTTITFNFVINIPNCGTVTDIDGNTYSTVQIGPQCWMRENLKTNHYKNDSIINIETDNAQWYQLTSDRWCLYNNDTSNNRVYGKMYNWFAASSSNGLCPQGWHVPSSAAWDSLVTYLTDNSYGYEGSGNDVAKSLASNAGWQYSNILGTPGNDQLSNNSSAFTALPGGYRAYNGNFDLLGYGGYFWASSEYDIYNAYRAAIGYNLLRINIATDTKTRGLYVRCIKDN